MWMPNRATEELYQELYVTYESGTTFSSGLDYRNYITGSIYGTVIPGGGRKSKVTAFGVKIVQEIEIQFSWEDVEEAKQNGIYIEEENTRITIDGIEYMVDGVSDYSNYSPIGCIVVNVSRGIERNVN